MYDNIQDYDTIWKFIERENFEDAALTTLVIWAIDQGLDIPMGIGLGNDEDGRLYMYVETPDGEPTSAIVRDYKPQLLLPANEENIQLILTQIAQDVEKLRQLLKPVANEVSENVSAA